jgi:hypothetical protein
MYIVSLILFQFDSSRFPGKPIDKIHELLINDNLAQLQKRSLF